MNNGGDLTGPSLFGAPKCLRHIILKIRSQTTRTTDSSLVSLKANQLQHVEQELFHSLYSILDTNNIFIKYKYKEGSYKESYTHPYPVPPCQNKKLNIENKNSLKLQKIIYNIHLIAFII